MKTFDELEHDACLWPAADCGLPGERGEFPSHAPATNRRLPDSISVIRYSSKKCGRSATCSRCGIAPISARRLVDEGYILSSTLRNLCRLAKRFRESFHEGGWNFYTVRRMPIHKAQQLRA